MESSNAQPFLRQLFRVYSYIDSVDGVAFNEIGALLNAIGDGLDYATLTNGLDVLQATGILNKRETGYEVAMRGVDVDGFKDNIINGLGFNESKVVAETFESEGVKDISPEGDVEFWKAYIPAQRRYLLPYLDDLGLLSFDESGRVIIIRHESIIAQRIVDSIRKSSARRKSLETLLKELEEKRRIGAAAEAIAMAYERRRVFRFGGAKEPELVSNDYVNAGYDILSYADKESSEFDRYIEIKATGVSQGFYLSRNELSQAENYGSSYFIYLVDVVKSTPDNPVISIIQNPSAALFDENSDWVHEVESYHFARIGIDDLHALDNIELDQGISD